MIPCKWEMCGQEVCVNQLNDVRLRPVKPKKVFKSACVVLTWVCHM